MSAFTLKKVDLYLLLVLAGLALAQFALFLPNNHVVSDIWDYWKFQESGVSLLFQPTTRPLAHSFFWVAWTISPHSWTVLNVAHVLVMILKAIATYWFVAQLLPRRAALLTGALILVFPASFGVYSMWTVNVNLILTALIIALASLVWISRSFRLIGAVLLVAGLTYSLLSYEMGWPLALLGPVVLLVSGAGRYNRRALALWYGTLVTVAIILGAILLSARSHIPAPDTGVHFARASGIFDLSLETLPISIASLFNAYRIHLIGVFEEATAYLTASLRSPLVLISVASGVAVGSTLLALTWRGTRRVPTAKWTRAALLGLLYIGLGYAPISITLLRTDRFHEFIYSSFGAALFFAAVLCGLHDWLSLRVRADRLWSIGLAGVAAAIMALFTFRSLDLTLAIITNANEQKAFGESIVLQVPDPQPGSAFFVFDTERRLYRLFEERVDRVGSMLGTVYEDHEVPVFVCRAEGEPWSYDAVCDVREDGIHVYESSESAAQIFPLAKTVIFETVVTDAGLRAEITSIGPEVAGSSELPRRIVMLRTTPLPGR